MSTVPLPDEPDLGQLRNQARELQRQVRAGDLVALAEVAERHPGGPVDPGAAASFPLAAAQLVVARRHGLRTWTRLKRHVEAIEHYSRFPARMVADDPGDLAERFLQLACLSYEQVGPSQWEEARALAQAHPEIVEGNVHVASAVGDAAAVGRMLDADPTTASSQGGPYRWEPLLYLAYARHDPGISQSGVLDTAGRLLAAGADPNAGYLWHGLPSPFTVLTGVFGEGEQGPVRQPRHPHATALGRLLLEAGAEPNDAQVLYNRMFGPDNDHLELLLEFGLGTGDGGPWRRRLGDVLEPPVPLVRGQLAWAVAHGMAERRVLLADHGVDITSPMDGGPSDLLVRWAAADGDPPTPALLATTTGHPDLVDLLVERGVPRPAPSPAAQLTAALLAGDRPGVDRLRRAHPGLVGRIQATRPGLVAWASTTGRPEVVELLVDVGFDVDSRGRTDLPANQPWHTALHGPGRVRRPRPGPYPLAPRGRPRRHGPAIPGHTSGLGPSPGPARSHRAPGADHREPAPRRPVTRPSRPGRCGCGDDPRGLPRVGPRT